MLLLVLLVLLVWSPAVLGQLGDELDLTDFDFGIVGRNFFFWGGGVSECFYFLVLIFCFFLALS